MKPSNAALAVLLSGALLLAGGRASATPGSDGGAALLAEDYLRALMHMEAGAEAKEPRSMHGLGVLYQNGHGVKKDLSLAQKWYTPHSKRRFIIKVTRNSAYIGPDLSRWTRRARDFKQT